MSYVEVNRIPEGLKVVKNEEDIVMLKYNSTNLFLILLTYIISTFLVISIVIFVVLLGLPNHQGYSVTSGMIFMIVTTILFEFAVSKKYTKIIIKPEYISIKDKKYKPEFIELHSSHKSVGIYNMHISYGAETYRLPFSRKDGMDIVNYINPIITSMGTKNVSSNAFDKGEREQRF